mmetsp:Transcript_22034/g.51669  ORF Transcript_22034/g.51669 Transcript_22034/m.51669 type:complete len:357 (-) Transcript_22034:152-1222(-)|eukprot:CAMPEP_0114548370 /NCGR_PEP_ID=MMETSP0114-20121206/4944_1 /TAXON_ID=31324 /ORGANISM="Goniomonas sp, Strain m" /LENGTH=356 /DNA_ID=CAMNT_0001732953 /DNA_START=123 /DNA_END=1193 /DNA_ORIENTATION=+
MLKFLKPGKEESDPDAIKIEIDPAWVAQHETVCAALKGSRLADYDVMNTLGTGSFGRVKLVRHKQSKKVFALKCLSKSLVIRTKQAEHILAEKEILSSVVHPFIVNLFGTFQDDTTLYFALEYVIGGEFFTHLRKANRFPEHTARFFGASVVAAFEHLHSRDIIYRDLKPENLLLDRNGYLKICDFGFARHIEPASKTWTLCGTPEYLAPEIILNKGHGKAVDWWALGILLYEMLVGYPPFYSDDRMALYQQILQGKIEFPRHVSKQARDLISKLLQADLSRRLGNLRHGARDVRKHPWFRGFDFNALVKRQLPPPIPIAVQGDDDTSLFDEYPEDDDPELSARISDSDNKVFDNF